MKRYDLVVFDWDGTLMDTTDAIAEGIAKAFDALGYSHPGTEKIKRIIGLDWKSAVKTLVTGFRDSDMPAFEAEYRKWYLKKEKTIGLFPGTVELLHSLKKSGTKLAIATGKSRAGLRRVFRQTGIESLFDATVTADESEPKPAPDMLIKIAGLTGTPLSRAVMVGDTTHDTDMACCAGCGAIAVTYGAFPREAFAGSSAVICDSIEELRSELGVKSPDSKH